MLSVVVNVELAYYRDRTVAGVRLADMEMGEDGVPRDLGERAFFRAMGPGIPLSVMAEAVQQELLSRRFLDWEVTHGQR